MAGSAKPAVYIFLQLSDTARGLNEGEGNECACLSWMDFRELQFISTRRDKRARTQRFKIAASQGTGVRGGGANLNLSFVFEEYGPLAPLVCSSDTASLAETDHSLVRGEKPGNAQKSEGSGLMCNFAA